MKSIELWDHALEVDEDLGYVIVHPPECLGIYHWSPEPEVGLLSIGPHLELEYPRCPVEWESINVGLTDRWNDNCWNSLAVEDFPGGEDGVMNLAAMYAKAGTPMPIYVSVYYGWTPSTPSSPSEYEWEFTWRPQTESEIAGDRE